MSFLNDFFKSKKQSSASDAKARLSMLLATEKSGLSQNEMTQMREEILQVIAKYMQIDASKLKIKKDSKDDLEVLELEIPLES
jgi:cell division topological specificity factor